MVGHKVLSGDVPIAPLGEEKKFHTSRAGTPVHPEPPAMGGPAPDPKGDRRWKHRRGRMGLQFLGSTANTSIAQAMRETARACHRLGYDVAFRNPEHGEEQKGWPSTSVRHLWGQLKHPYVVVGWGRSRAEASPGTPTVEFDVADGWAWSRSMDIVSRNSLLDMLVLPAESNVQEFQDAGITCPVEFIPLGVDPNVYRPWDPDPEILNLADWGPWVNAPLDGVTVFLAAGYLQERKGLLETLEAFKRAFSQEDRVALLVKNVPRAWGQSQRGLVNAYRDTCRIGLLEETLPELAMARLYSTVDLFVNTHHREGFGLMPLQAMACGTPSILTEVDGPLVYADRTTSYMVPPVSIGTVNTVNVPPNAWWAHLDPNAIAQAMREAYDNISQRHAKKVNGLSTAAEFTWERTAQELVLAVETRIGPVRRRPPRVPYHTEREILSVAIPCRNGAPDLDRCLGSLKEHTNGRQWSLDVVVFDDASTDDTAAVAVGHGASVIRTQVNVGEGAGRDILLDHVRGEFVFLTDADVEFRDPEWARVLTEWLADRERTVAHPLVALPNGLTWGAGGLLRSHGGQVLPAGHRHENEAWEGLVDMPPVEVPYAPTVGWMTRTRDLVDALDWVGGYFPTIFADVDMAYWLRSQGWEFWNVPQTHIVHHAGGYTVGQTTSEDQRDRFQAHAQEFSWWWREWVDHDMATKWRGEVSL